MIETFSKGYWKATESPLPANASATEPGGVGGVVSCGSRTCAIASGYWDGRGHSEGLLETLSDGSWHPVEAPVPDSATTLVFQSLDNVSCGAGGTCVAIGDLEDRSGTRGLIETLSNGSWSAKEAPQPADASSIPDIDLLWVSCGAGGNCAAEGYYTSRYSTFPGADAESLIETLSNGSWTAVEAPVPIAEFLRPITCGAARTCVALIGYGRYGEPGAVADGVIETLANGSWTAIKAPLPVNAGASPYLDLGGASCSTGGTCVAVGTYVDSAGLTEGLIESFSGASSGTR